MTGPERLMAYTDPDQWVRSGFNIQDPDDSFITHLHRELMDKHKHLLGTDRGQGILSKRPQWFARLKPAFSSSAWALIAILLIFALIWGIKALIPRGVPASSTLPSPSPFLTPTQQQSTTPTPHVDVENFVVLTETDLNCDSRSERILGVLAPEIEYFNIKPELSDIKLEAPNAAGYETAWEESAREAGVAYLGYQLFKADSCNQFLVVLGHKGKESINVYRWDGKQLTNVLSLSGRFLFSGDWTKDIFGDYQSSPNTLYLVELEQLPTSSKNTWILTGYQWSDGKMKPVTEKRVESGGGG